MKKIYIGNLSFQANEQEVEDIFKQFGEIEDIVLIRDRFTNRLKGFGFITFTTPEAAQEAISLDGKELMGRPVKVSIAKEREKRFGSGGGGDRGRGGNGGGRDRY